MRDRSEDRERSERWSDRERTPRMRDRDDERMDRDDDRRSGSYGGSRGYEGRDRYGDRDSGRDTYGSGGWTDRGSDFANKSSYGGGYRDYDGRGRGNEDHDDHENRYTRSQYGEYLGRQYNEDARGARGGSGYYQGRRGESGRRESEYRDSHQRSDSEHRGSEGGYRGEFGRSRFGESGESTRGSQGGYGRERQRGSGYPSHEIDEDRSRDTERGYGGYASSNDYGQQQPTSGRDYYRDDTLSGNYRLNHERGSDERRRETHDRGFDAADRNWDRSRDRDRDRDDDGDRNRWLRQ